ncbi:MAG: deoxyribonuclease IV, partial [Planctomycetota bacterium]
HHEIRNAQHIAPADLFQQKILTLLAKLRVRRGDVLGIPYLVMHPGAHMGQGEEKGIKRIAVSLGRVIKRAGKRSATTICLESTAGQGTTIGADLQHLGDIIAACTEADRLGVCLDTAHLFAAGYDFRGRKYAGFKKQLDAAVGLDRVKVWHLNDSKKELGSRVDRHDHIGLGTIGDEGFRPIVRDKLWKNVPKILETPKGKTDDGRAWDRVNVERLQHLAK